MSKSRIAVFWTDEDTHDWLLSELLQGRLRQGWGIPGAQLADDGKVLSFERWMERFVPLAQKAWNWNPTVKDCKTRHGILSRMIHLQRGDLVVVPRMPCEGEFCIAQVTDGYFFDDSHFDQVKDFGHVLRVDKNNLKNYRYNSSPEAAAIAAKFRHYRSAVNNVADENYAEKIRSFYIIKKNTITIDKVRAYLMQNQNQSIADQYRDSGVIELEAWEDRQAIAREFFGMEFRAYHESAHAVFHVLTASNLNFVTIDPFVVADKASNSQVEAICQGGLSDAPFCEILIASAGVYGSRLFNQIRKTSLAYQHGALGDMDTVERKAGEVVNLLYPDKIAGSEDWLSAREHIIHEAMNLMDFIILGTNRNLVNECIVAVAELLIAEGTLRGADVIMAINDRVSSLGNEEALTKLVAEIAEKTAPWNKQAH